MQRGQNWGVIEIKLHYIMDMLQSTEDSAVEGGGECNTPVLTLFAFK